MYIRMISIVLLVNLCPLGCIDSSSQEPAPTRSDSGNDVDDSESDAWSHSCVREVIAEQPNTQLDLSSPDEIFENLNDEDWKSRYPNGHILQFQGRAELSPTRRQDEFWLEADATAAVFDIGIVEWGHDAPRAYDLVVLSDFQPVRFSMQVAESPAEVPSADAAIQDLEPARSHQVLLGVDDPLAITITIPTAEFEGQGSHDLRVVALPAPEPNDEAHMTRRRTPISWAGIINVGTPTSLGNASFPQLSVQPVEHLPWGIGYFLGGTAGTFLMPPEEAIDLETDDNPADVRLGKDFDVSQPTANMRVYLSGASEEEAGPVYVVAFDGTDVLETASGFAEVPERPIDTAKIKDNSVSNYAVELSFDRELTSDRGHSFRVVKFAYPFCRNPEGGGLYPHEDATISNTVFVRHTQ